MKSCAFVILCLLVGGALETWIFWPRQKHRIVTDGHGKFAVQTQTFGSSYHTSLIYDSIEDARKKVAEEKRFDEERRKNSIRWRKVE